MFGPIADAHIVVDMIIQNASADGTTDLTFTVSKADYKKALSIVEKTAPAIAAKGVDVDTDIAKVSVVGVGMRTHAGVAAKMFQVLAQEGVNIEMISTSEIKISVVIDGQVYRARGTGAARGIHRKTGEGMKDVLIYDTTLRDGCQAEDISFTLEDKLRIAEKLEELGVDYIEGGYPGSNTRDADFFKQVKEAQSQERQNCLVWHHPQTQRKGSAGSEPQNSPQCRSSGGHLGRQNLGFACAR